MVTRLIVGMLYDVHPADPAVLAIAIAILSAGALVASDLPARRATQVDPLVALRSE
jgi:ABC-type lipoprotein release transport system permease subunit